MHHLLWRVFLTITPTVECVPLLLPFKPPKCVVCCFACAYTYLCTHLTVTSLCRGYVREESHVLLCAVMLCGCVRICVCVCAPRTIEQVVVVVIAGEESAGNLYSEQA